MLGNQVEEPGLLIGLEDLFEVRTEILLDTVDLVVERFELRPQLGDAILNLFRCGLASAGTTAHQPRRHHAAVRPSAGHPELTHHTHRRRRHRRRSLRPDTNQQAAEKDGYGY